MKFTKIFTFIGLITLLLTACGAEQPTSTPPADIPASQPASNQVEENLRTATPKPNASLTPSATAQIIGSPTPVANSPFEAFYGNRVCGVVPKTAQGYASLGGDLFTLPKGCDFGDELFAGKFFLRFGHHGANGTSNTYFNVAAPSKEDLDFYKSIFPGISAARVSGKFVYCPDSAGICLANYDVPVKGVFDGKHDGHVILNYFIGSGSGGGKGGGGVIPGGNPNGPPPPPVPHPGG